MTTRHERLFNQYVEELMESKLAAECWWDALLNHEESLVGDRNEALRRLKHRWPCGPSAYPRVIAVLRKYFFACLALSNQVAAKQETDEEEVYPQIFLTEWLLDGKHDHLAEFLATLSYWPIGMDIEGNYV